MDICSNQPWRFNKSSFSRNTFLEVKVFLRTISIYLLICWQKWKSFQQKTLNSSKKIGTILHIFKKLKKDYNRSIIYIGPNICVSVESLFEIQQIWRILSVFCQLTSMTKAACQTRWSLLFKKRGLRTNLPRFLSSNKTR